MLVLRSAAPFQEHHAGQSHKHCRSLDCRDPRRPIRSAPSRHPPGHERQEQAQEELSPQMRYPRGFRYHPSICHGGMPGQSPFRRFPSRNAHLSQSPLPAGSTFGNHPTAAGRQAGEHTRELPDRARMPRQWREIWRTSRNPQSRTRSHIGSRNPSKNSFVNLKNILPFAPAMLHPRQSHQPTQPSPRRRHGSPYRPIFGTQVLRTLAGWLLRRSTVGSRKSLEPD